MEFSGCRLSFIRGENKEVNNQNNQNIREESGSNEMGAIEATGKFVEIQQNRREL